MSYNVSFISLGCAKNQVNCEQMMALCAEAGYSIQAQPEGCDVVVVNTCGFLASACEEAIENILEMAELKNAGQVKKILVTGCMTQRYKEDIFHELPEVDGLLGTGSYGDIATAIAEVMEKGEKPCHLGNIHTANQSGERILSTPPWYAYLRIAEGCDNHCAYCVIPSLRGKYRSRPMEGLLEEARELADAGVKELLVIAQDITRYGTDLNGEHQLASLLRELCRLDFHWVRLHYLYPDEITEELIDTIAAQPHLCKHLHLPVQCGSDELLKKMNRHYTIGQYMELIEYARKKVPGITFSSDIIVGFPGETEEDFQGTLELVKKVGYMQLFTFIYSKRTGTKAAEMPDPTPRAEKTDRMTRLLKVQDEIAMDLVRQQVGQTVRVLVEGYGRSDGTLSGRLDNNLTVEFAADPALMGSYAQVHLTGARATVLLGELET